MHKEKIIQHGLTVVTNFHANVPFFVVPSITLEYLIDGIRHYRDSIGGVHNADTFDRVWGKRDSKKILPKSKPQFQRIHKF